MKAKKILFGSIFVLVMILLMPSIPAIEQKTIEDKVYSDLLEEIKTLDDDIKLPIVFALLNLILNFRLYRISLLVQLDLINIQRADIVFTRTIAIFFGLTILSNILGLGWDFGISPYPYFLED